MTSEWHLVLDDFAHLTPEGGRQRQVTQWGDGRISGNGAEVALDPSASLRRVDVAGNGKHRIVRGVVGPEEGGYVLDRGGVKILHGTDRGVVVGMGGRKDMSLQLVEPLPIRAVVIGRTLFVLDDLSLVVEVGLIERVE